MIVSSMSCNDVVVNRTKIVSSNPLKSDPTRTKTLRRAFEQEFRRRFQKLKGLILQLVVVEDAFGLKQKVKPTVARLIGNIKELSDVQSTGSQGETWGSEETETANRETDKLVGSKDKGLGRESRVTDSSIPTENQRFAFRNSAEQVRLFNEWLKTQVDTEILTVTEAQASDAYWRKFSQDAYEKGAGRAFNDVRKPALSSDAAGVSDFFEGSRREFLRQSFASPVAIEKIQLLAGRVFTDLKGVTEAMGATMSRELAQGLAQGDHPDIIARRMVGPGSPLEKIGKRRAALIARTECLPGDTLVDSAMVRAVFRRFYKGDMIEIVTCNGRKFSATPNHPMLTQDGWISAGLLNKRHYLICNNRQQYTSSAGNQNVKRSPTTLAEIYDSLLAVGVSERVTTAKPDFHGDGTDSQVDILRPDRELRIGRFSSIGKPLVEQVFSPSGQAASRFCSKCGRLLSINEQTCFCGSSQSDTTLNKSMLDNIPIYTKAFGNRANRLVGSIAFDDIRDTNVCPVLVADSALLPREKLAFRISSRDSCLTEHFSDLFLLRADSSGDLPLSETRQIELDNVLSVSIRPFSGHVYNLQTPYGYYTINGAYTGNTIRAHAEGQLDSFERLGVDKIGVMAEWSTAGNERVCLLCQPLEGVVMTVKEARGLIPRHPDCKCSYVAANVGEDKNKKTRVNFTNPQTGKVEVKHIGQTRGKEGVEGAIDKSLSRQIPKGRKIKGEKGLRFKDPETGRFTVKRSKRTIAQEKNRAVWPGGRKTIAKKRPKSILEE